jgi:hypothetical protein
MAEPRVTRFDEASITRWLFGGPGAWTLWRHMRLPQFGSVRFCEPISTFPWHRSGPGDIDVLICDPAHADAAVAVECKRITVRPDTFDTGQPGRLADFKEGHAQVRGLLHLGVQRVFLLGIVEVDSTERQDLGVFERGLTADLSATIQRAGFFEDVPGEAGIALAEIEQHNDIALDAGGMVNITVIRNAATRRQPPDLTSRLQMLFKPS